MRIKSIKINNFRGFLGVHEIEFAHSNDESLTLILAENEVGKSTILNSIMWCFYNVLTSESDRPSSIIHDDAGKKGAYVEVTLIDEKQEYLFKRTINVNDEMAFKAWKINDIGEQEEKVNFPDRLINTLLPKELSNYFLFDGEGLKDISVDPTELRSAIRNIMGLNAAEEAISTFKEHIRQWKIFNKRTKDNIKAAESIKEEIATLDGELSERKVELDDLKQKYKQAEKKYNDANKLWEKIKSKDARKLKEERDAKKKTLSTTKGYLESFKSDRRKLISRYGTDVIGYGFFEETADCFKLSTNEPVKFPNPQYNEIIQGSLDNKKCLVCLQDFEENSDTHKYIQSLLSEVSNKDFDEKFTRARGGFESRQNTIQNFNTDLDKIDTNIANTTIDIKSQDNYIKELNDKIEAFAAMDDQVAAAEENLSQTWKNREEANANFNKKLGEINRIKEEKKSKLKSSGDSNDTNSVADKEIDFLNKTLNYLDNYCNNFEESGRETIMHEMNESLKIHSKGNHQFRFVDETYEPVIVKSDGKTPVVLSTGAKKLKRNLFFMTSLIKQSKLRAQADGEILIPGTIAPLVVDAPFSDLDEFNIKIAAEVLIESSDQLIVMVSSSAFNGGFLQTLNSNEKYKSKLGKTYILQRKFQGPKKDKSDLKVSAFGKVYKTAIYGSDHETSEIIEIKNG
tara:strand:- start:791 stop:2839 length:2049 start_codon:yes stop_codon:yes gene_type:complete